MKHSTDHMSSPLLSAIATPAVPAASRYREHVTKHLTHTALRRIVAMHRDGESWYDIAQSLGVSALIVQRAYNNLPKELK